MERTCEICGRGFNAPPARIRQGYGRFCSRPCYHKSRLGFVATKGPRGPNRKIRPRGPNLKLRRRVPLTCEACGVTFECRPCEVGRKRFCSKACMYQAMRNQETVACVWCGQPVTAPRSRIARKRIGVFCSLGCKGEWTSQYQRGAAHPMWKGGLTPFVYPREFHQVRNFIILRDNNQCQVCGSTKPYMAVHHIDEDTQNNALSNLVTVCPTCHRGVIHGTNEVTFDAQRRPVWKRAPK